MVQNSNIDVLYFRNIVFVWEPFSNKNTQDDVSIMIRVIIRKVCAVRKFFELVCATARTNSNRLRSANFFKKTLTISLRMICELALLRALTISLRFLRQKASARPRDPENACLYTSLRMPHETLLDTLPSRSTAICLKDAHVSTSHCDHLGRSKEAQIEPVEFHRNDGWLASTMREAP